MSRWTAAWIGSLGFLIVGIAAWSLLEWTGPGRPARSDIQPAGRDVQELSRAGPDLHAPYEPEDPRSNLVQGSADPDLARGELSPGRDPEDAPGASASNLVPLLLDKPFEEMDLAELRAASDHVNRILGEASTPEHLRRLENGLAEYLGPRSEVDFSVEDVETQLVSFHSVPGIGMYKTVLPPEEYPDLYAMKAKIREINSWVYRRTVAAQAAAGSDG